MNNPKEFYRNYQADNVLDKVDYKLIEVLSSFSPGSAFEFGCGSGKNLKLLKEKSHKDLDTCGLDISVVNVMQAHFNGVDSVIRGDERHFPGRKFDVVFTCSVLDHIEDIHNVIGNLQNMANKAIVLAETNSFDTDFYYKHDYESYGFVKIDFEFVSESDKGIYNIWVYKTPEYLAEQEETNLRANAIDTDSKIC
jgi:SAM-dependent methyltransferase